MKSILDYKAVIFDLDGTLIDSLYVWDSICRDWLLEKGTTPPDTLESDIEMMTLTQAAEYMIAAFGINMPPNRIISEWRRIALSQYQSSVALKCGTKQLLIRLADSGIRMAIATSCFPEACESVLRRHGIRDFFSAIVYSDEVGRDKSFPDVWLTCAAQLGISPEECAAVDDLPAAAKGIRAAGMRFISAHSIAYQAQKDI